MRALFVASIPYQSSRHSERQSQTFPEWICSLSVLLSMSHEESTLSVVLLAASTFPRMWGYCLLELLYLKENSTQMSLSGRQPLLGIQSHLHSPGGSNVFGMDLCQPAENQLLTSYWNLSDLLPNTSEGNSLMPPYLEVPSTPQCLYQFFPWVFPKAPSRWGKSKKSPQQFAKYSLHQQ